MSDLGIDEIGGSHGTHRGHGRGCVSVLVAVAVLVAIAVFAYVKGVGLIQGVLSGPDDYSGSGRRPAVTVVVDKGDLGADIADKLFHAGVVKSAEAFTQAANQDDRSSTIQAGRYRLLSKMSARAALEVLVNPDSIVKDPTVTIPEGLRGEEILASIVKQTSFTDRQVQAAYDDTASLGLPGYAHGDPEGYLFPSTYDLTPKLTAAELLRAMVERFKQEAESMGLEQGAEDLGYSPHDVVTIASLVQAESGSADMSKVSSVVYNRLAEPMRLQFDSALHYAVDSRGEVLAGKDLREIDSPYNTYTQDGLPPTPIDSPGTEALKAALEPADTGYLYFVTVNLKTGETRFTGSYRQHLRNVDRYRRYCEQSDEC